MRIHQYGSVTARMLIKKHKKCTNFTGENKKCLLLSNYDYQAKMKIVKRPNFILLLVSFGKFMFCKTFITVTLISASLNLFFYYNYR